MYQSEFQFNYDSRIKMHENNRCWGRPQCKLLQLLITTTMKQTVGFKSYHSEQMPIKKIAISNFLIPGDTQKVNSYS